MTDTLRTMNTRQHPQTEKAAPGQVKSAGGGYTFVVDDITRLRRFLATGVEGGTFYAGAKDVAVESVACLTRLHEAGRGVEAVQTIAEMSERGATMRQQATMFALAYLSGSVDAETRAAALTALPRVCRTASHLFLFASYVEQFRGWGRGLRKAVGRWYLDKPLDKVAYQGAKYRSRYGFTHRDLLRLSHPKPRRGALALDVALDGLDDEALDVRVRLNRALAAARGGRFEDALNHLSDAVHEGFEHFAPIHAALLDDRSRSALFDFLAGHDTHKMRDLPATTILAETLSAVTEAADIVSVLGDVQGASWEMVPSEHLGKSEVWEALLDGGHVPLGATLRNLARLTANGTLDRFGQDDRTATLIGRLRNSKALREARVHPMSVLLAAARYSTGRGDKSDLRWTPIPNINKALDAAFYASFDTIQPDAEHKVMIALDISGSMSNPVAGLPLSCRDASTALALALSAQFPTNLGVAFTCDSANQRAHWRDPDHLSLTPLDLDTGRRVTDVIRDTQDMTFGGTDCSLPMLHALSKGYAIETFIVLTDNETWAGKMHPHEALRLYRERTGINARMVTVAMQNNSATIADPSDPLMLDVVGLDDNVVGLVADFVAGRI